MPNAIYTCFVTLEIQHMNRCHNLTHIQSLLAKNIKKFQTDFKSFWGTNNKRMGVQQSHPTWGLSQEKQWPWLRVHMGGIWTESIWQENKVFKLKNYWADVQLCFYVYSAWWHLSRSKFFSSVTDSTRWASWCCCSALNARHAQATLNCTRNSRNKISIYCTGCQGI